MEAMGYLLNDLQKSEKLSHLLAWMHWLDYLKESKPDTGLLALLVLCFTMLMRCYRSSTHLQFGIHSHPEGFFLEVVDK